MPLNQDPTADYRSAIYGDTTMGGGPGWFSNPSQLYGLKPNVPNWLKGGPGASLNQQQFGVNDPSSGGQGGGGGSPGASGGGMYDPASYMNPNYQRAVQKMFSTLGSGQYTQGQLGNRLLSQKLGTISPLLSSMGIGGAGGMGGNLGPYGPYGGGLNASGGVSVQPYQNPYNPIYPGQQQQAQPSQAAQFNPIY